MKVRTRFAPSPTGYLHLGHAHSALAGWQAARDAGGRFLLRIEDIDPARCRPEYEAAIFEDLAWLGLDWEVPVRRQSEHMADYRAALDRLDAMGVVYPCFCSRKEIAEFAVAHKLPSITAYKEYAEAGGMLSYGSTLVELGERAAEMVAKILRGAKPHELPMQQATRVYLTINLKAARAIGQPIPQAMLQRADYVIDDN